MKLINRHQFTNDALFETYHLNANDCYLNDVPECDVIALSCNNPERMTQTFLVIRPDEALIMAQLLIEAVYQVTEGYATSSPSCLPVGDTGDEDKRRFGDFMAKFSFRDYLITERKSIAVDREDGPR